MLASDAPTMAHLKKSLHNSSWRRGSKPWAPCVLHRNNSTHISPQADKKCRDHSTLAILCGDQRSLTKCQQPSHWPYLIVPLVMAPPLFSASLWKRVREDRQPMASHGEILQEKAALSTAQPEGAAAGGVGPREDSREESFLRASFSPPTRGGPVP